MINIYIPSMGRSFKNSMKPTDRMPQHWKDRVFFVVPEDEFEKYMKWAAQPSSNLLGCSILPCPEKGIAATRHWIGKFAADHLEPTFAMLDDDCAQLSVRRTEDKYNLRNQEPADFDQMMAAIEDHLTRYVHVGISTREGNNRHTPGPPPLPHENTRTLRFLCYQTEAFLSVEHGRVPVMEDFDVNLQLLRKGLPNVCLFHWAQGQLFTSAPGGCSTYRTHEMQEQAAKTLQELHGSFVKLRQKKNKGGGEFGVRTEVTIRWQNAFKSGQIWLKKQDPNYVEPVSPPPRIHHRPKRALSAAEKATGRICKNCGAPVKSPQKFCSVDCSREFWRVSNVPQSG